jgi:hypothetical protein
MKKLSIIACIISVSVGLNAESVKTEQLNLVKTVKKNLITPSLAVKKIKNKKLAV